MKIKLEDKKLLVDEIEKDISTITENELEEWFEAAISGLLEYDLLDVSHPLYEFFNGLQEETKDGSEFIKSLKELEESIKQKNEELAGADNDKQDDKAVVKPI